MMKKDVDDYLKKMAEISLPTHLREVSERLEISEPTASKLLSILEAERRIESKRLGSSWVVYRIRGVE